MHKSHWLVSVFFIFTLGMASAFAADTGSIEQIKPDSSNAQHKECPMLQGKKECDHKKCDHTKDGKPCPYHAGDKHHGKKHEQCDHKQAG